MEQDRPAGEAPSLAHVRRRAGVKWSRYGPDVLAAWVADMDFDPPAAVTDVLREMVDRGDLGYRVQAHELAPTYADWQRRRYGWRPDEARVRTFTSALHALETVMWSMTEPGDGVVVFTPIYHPFLTAIDESGRRRVDVPLDRDGWRIDPERLEAAIDPTTRLVLFCQPHNPSGRVFDDDEVAAVAAVAERHDLLVISDEIWCDLTYERTHRPLAIVDERFAGRLITIGSASKSFNLAGLRCAVAHIDHAPVNDALTAMPTHLLGAPSTLGVAGTLAAWRGGSDWLEWVRAELAARRGQLATRLAADLPEVGFDVPEATYLAWLDFGSTPIAAEPSYRLLKEAGVALSEGVTFGDQGASWARLNFATTSAILDEVVDRIAALVQRVG